MTATDSRTRPKLVGLTSQSGDRYWQHQKVAVFRGLCVVRRGGCLLAAGGLAADSRARPRWVARRKQVADRLNLTANTVRTHMQNIMAKLGAHSALEAVAVTHAWLGPPDGP